MSSKNKKNIEKEIKTLEKELLNDDLNVKGQVSKYNLNQKKIKDLIKELEEVKNYINEYYHKTKSESDGIINYDDFMSLLKEIDKEDEKFINNMEKMSLDEMVDNYVNLNTKIDLCLDFLEAQKIDLIEE